jgi:hypothetical protein
VPKVMVWRKQRDKRCADNKVVVFLFGDVCVNLMKARTIKGWLHHACVSKERETAHTKYEKGAPQSKRRRGGIPNSNISVVLICSLGNGVDRCLNAVHVLYMGAKSVFVLSCGGGLLTMAKESVCGRKEWTCCACACVCSCGGNKKR